MTAERPLRYPDEITTERLWLRGLHVDDVPALYSSVMSQPEVARYLAWRPATSLEEAARRVESILEAARSGDEVTWTVLGRERPDRPIGMFTVWTTELGQELGFCLAADVWGQGYMTEAVTAVTGRLLGTPDVVRVWALCDVDNLASARVLERAGFEREGRLRRCAVHPNLGPEHRDGFLYARVSEG